MICDNILALYIYVLMHNARTKIHEHIMCLHFKWLLPLILRIPTVVIIKIPRMDVPLHTKAAQYYRPIYLTTSSPYA